MATLMEPMTSLYVFTDDYLQAHSSLLHWRRSPNNTPASTEAEAITIALRQGCLGVATLKPICSS